MPLQLDDSNATVKFYRTESGAEPVREWLYGLSQIDRKMIGDDIKTVQFGWPKRCTRHALGAQIEGGFVGGADSTGVSRRSRCIHG
jgi:hypothetical protein